MKGINKAIIVGTLGKDPEVRYTNNGEAVCHISIATSEKWKGQDGQQKEKTEWHKVVAFKRLAEIMGQYLLKGSKVYIEGKLQTTKWQDNNGNDKYTTEIVARDMQMLDSANQQQGNNQNSGQNQNNQQSNHSQNNQHNNQQNNQSQQPSQAPDNFDMDVPF